MFTGDELALSCPGNLGSVPSLLMRYSASLTCGNPEPLPDNGATSRSIKICQSVNWMSRRQVVTMQDLFWFREAWPFIDNGSGLPRFLRRLG